MPSPLQHREDRVTPLQHRVDRVTPSAPSPSPWQFNAPSQFCNTPSHAILLHAVIILLRPVAILQHAVATLHRPVAILQHAVAMLQHRRNFATRRRNLFRNILSQFCNTAMLPQAVATSPRRRNSQTDTIFNTKITMFQTSTKNTKNTKSFQAVRKADRVEGRR